MTDIDPEAHASRPRRHRTTTTNSSSPGGTPTQLPVENSDAEGIHHFWTFQDARGIREHADEADQGIVVGAGLLGIDLAAVRAAQEIDAKYLMRGNRWWRYALSEEGAEIIHEALEANVSNPSSNPASTTSKSTTTVTSPARSTPTATTTRANGPASLSASISTPSPQRDRARTRRRRRRRRDMQTNVEDIYAAGDLTQFYDTILDSQAQNGAWGSAKEQGTIAAKNMVDYGSEEFRWVSSYSITHFDFPFLSFGHPTLGDDHVEAKYSDTEWRRLAIKDGKIVGGVLIGDLSPQTKYKQLMREQRQVGGQKEILGEGSRPRRSKPRTPA